MIFYSIYPFFKDRIFTQQETANTAIKTLNDLLTY
jgi:hypothetical protein